MSISWDGRLDPPARANYFELETFTFYALTAKVVKGLPGPG